MNTMKMLTVTICAEDSFFGYTSIFFYKAPSSRIPRRRRRRRRRRGFICI